MDHFKKTILIFFACLVISCCLLVQSGCSTESQNQENSSGFTVSELQSDQDQNLGFSFIRYEDIANLRIYSAVADSMRSIDALNIAADKAVNFCKSSNELTEIFDQRVFYHGMDRVEKKITRYTKCLWDKNLALSSSRDYRAVLRFRCMQPTERDSEIRKKNIASGDEVK
jgi:hypothetical protein